MTEQLERMIQTKVKNILQSHLDGTPEEFEAASSAVMDELSFLGGNLQGLVSSISADITTSEGREELAEQLIQSLIEEN